MENKAISSDNIKTLTTAIKQYVDSRPASMSEEDIRALILRTTGMTEDEAWLVEHQNDEYITRYSLNINKFPVTSFPNCKRFDIRWSCENLTYIPFLYLPVVEDMANCFEHYYMNLRLVEKIYAPCLKNARSMFEASSIVKGPQFISFYSGQSTTELVYSLQDTSKMFYNCKNLEEIQFIPMGKVVEASSMFENCYNLKSLPEMDLSSCKYLDRFIYYCKKLQRIEDIRLGSVLESNASCFHDTGQWNLHYCLIKNIGLAKDITSWYFNTFYEWGVGNDENRRSLVDTLLTYSIDRTKFSNYEPCVIGLYKTTKLLLTDEEIAAITAKGYTIA